MIHPPVMPWGGPHEASYLTAKYGLGDVAIDMRKAVVASPLRLASEVLSTLWPKNLLVRPSDVHRQAEAAMLEQVDTILVDARATAKTTLLVETGTISQGLRFPDDTNLLMHSSDRNSRALSESVRLHPTTNEAFRRLFPDYAIDGRSDLGNVNAWSWPCRRRGGREQSVETATPGAQTAGRHYDRVNASDWMNENTTPLYGKATREEMTKIVEQFSQVRAILQRKEVNERAHYLIDSNRWDCDDLVGVLTRNDDRNRIRKIVGGVRGESGAFVSSWPQWQAPEAIQAIYDDPSMTRRMFQANYRGEPMSDAGEQFSPEWFDEYPEDPKAAVDAYRLRVQMTVDCASMEVNVKKRSDRSAVVVLGFAVNTGRAYVLAVRAGKWTTHQLMELLYAMAQEWRPTLVGIEKCPGTSHFLTSFRADMARTGRRMPLVELDTGNREKGVRMMPAHVFAEQNHVMVKKRLHGELIEELTRFRQMERDDIADAFAYHFYSWYFARAGKRPEPPRLEMVPPTPPQTGQDVWNEMKRRQAARKRRERIRA